MSHSGFTAAKDDGGGGDNWSYNTCKAPVISSPPTNPLLTTSYVITVITLTGTQNLGFAISNPKFSLKQGTCVWQP